MKTSNSGKPKNQILRKTGQATKNFKIVVTL